jgi:hypothetical protein
VSDQEENNWFTHLNKKSSAILQGFFCIMEK